MTDEPALCGTWIHSYEEDRDGLQVYRPAGFPFPPARGRGSLTLDADGQASTGAPGPVDRGTTAPARWMLSGSELTVVPSGGSASDPGTSRFDVVSVDAQRMTLRPVPPAVAEEPAPKEQP